MAQGYDIWDKVRGEMDPRKRIDPREEMKMRMAAMANGENQPQIMPDEMGGEEDMEMSAGVSQSPVPAGMRAQGPTQRPPDGRPRRAPSQYQSGNPEDDAFLQQRATTGPDADEAFPAAWEDPEEFERMRKGAYYAGASGDDSMIREILSGPYGQTPMGRQIARAYEEGKASRGQGRR
jgi:hypothetical protein